MHAEHEPKIDHLTRPAIPGIPPCYPYLMLGYYGHSG
jgi:hypothetical protein